MEAVKEALNQDIESKTAGRKILVSVMKATMALFGLREETGDRLKTSNGLQAVFIDMSRFNQEPLIKGGLMPRMMFEFFTVLSGVTRARREYRRTIKTPSVTLPQASPGFWEDIKKKAAELGIGTTGRRAQRRDARVLSDTVWLNPVRRFTAGLSLTGSSRTECLSRMMGNHHVRI